MKGRFNPDVLTYIPALRSRQAELRGYSELSDVVTERLCPVISLGKLGRIVAPAQVAERIAESVKGIFFLDLNTFPDQQCDGWQRLGSSEDNFINWRQFIKSVPLAIPVALIREGMSERAFVRQVLAMERDHGFVAIRSRRSASDLLLMQAAMAAVEDVNSAILIIDLGYIRASFEAKEVEASRMINALRTTEPSARIAIMSSSFPRAVSAFGDEGGTLEIMERQLHARLGGDEVAIYSDHAAIYPDPFMASAARWVPRIDYANVDSWIFRRKRADDGGYPQCAREIVARPDWDAEFAAQNWGASAILNQSQERQPLRGFGSPSAWIAARVNMHLQRQAVEGEAAYDEAEPEEFE